MAKRSLLNLQTTLHAEWWFQLPGFFNSTFLKCLASQSSMHAYKTSSTNVCSATQTQSHRMISTHVYKARATQLGKTATAPMVMEDATQLEKAVKTQASEQSVDATQLEKAVKIQASEKSVDEACHRFSAHVEHWRVEARRSLLVQVSSTSVVPDLVEFLHSSGLTCKHVFPYQVQDNGSPGSPHSKGKGQQQIFALVVLDGEIDQESIRNLLSSDLIPQAPHPAFRNSVSLNHQSSPHTPGRMLRFLGVPSSSSSKSPSMAHSSVGDPLDSPGPVDDVDIRPTERLGSVSGRPDLAECLRDAGTTAGQIWRLHEVRRMTELDQRLRFFLCAVLEESALVLQPEGADPLVYPFGSSISGVGTRGSDLDVVLYENVARVNCAQGEADTRQPPFDIDQLSMNLSFIPGMHVEAVIPYARVPIIKFRHAYTGLHGDVCMNEPVSLAMAELVYTLGELGPALRPLAHCLHAWARRVRLTRPPHLAHPGPHFKNLYLTLMATFFLQMRGALPSYASLLRAVNRGDNQKNVIRGRVRPSGTEEPLDALLHEFFDFYRRFDFRRHAVDCGRGALVSKVDNNHRYGSGNVGSHQGNRPRARPLAIVNPFPGAFPRNIAWNVNQYNLQKFSDAVESALWTLDNGGRSSEAAGDGDSWGIIPLVCGGESRRASMNVVKRVL